MVECPTTDPKIVGSNPGCAKIRLHVFHKPHNGHEYWFSHPGSKHRERLSISSENLFRNRCKINKFKPNTWLCVTRLLSIIWIFKIDCTSSIFRPITLPFARVFIWTLEPLQSIWTRHLPWPLRTIHELLTYIGVRNFAFLFTLVFVTNVL